MQPTLTRRTLLLALATPVAYPRPARAQVATPHPGMMVEAIAEARIDALASGPAFIGIARFTFPPAVRAGGGSFSGPRLFVVEAGTLTLDLAEPAHWFPAPGTATPEPALARGANVTLAPGERLITTGLPPIEVRNDGLSPAIFLDAAVWPGAPSDIGPFTSDDGIVFEPLASGTVESLPPAPVAMRLDRLQITSRDPIDLGAMPGPRLLVVDTGTLVLGAVAGRVTYAPAAVNSPGSVPGRSRTIFVGDRALLTAGGAALIEPGAVVTAENLGRREMRLLCFSLMPVVPDSATRT